MPESCVGEFCKVGNKPRTIVTEPYTSSVTNKLVSRCMGCISPKSRSKVSMLKSKKYEHVLVNDILIALLKKKVISQSDMENVHHDSQSIPGSNKRPDLLLKFPGIWINIEIDELQHFDPRNLEKDEQRRLEFKKRAHGEKKSRFVTFRWRVGEGDKDPLMEVKDNKIEINNGKFYNGQMADLASNVRNALDDPMCKSQAPHFNRCKKSLENIKEEPRLSKTKSKKCKAIKKDGDRCTNKPKENSDCCGTHAKSC